MFRDLRADEIECRVAQARDSGVSLLLYKDARADQTILDETVGPMNWQRHHGRENANCIVSIWDKEKEQWIGKEDTGTESNTEKEKGLASDSFKRACFNWGIGRELYTAPFIWIKAADCTALKQNNSGKWQCFDSFEVNDITIENKHITGLTIINSKTRKTVFAMGKQGEPSEDKPQPFKRAETVGAHHCEDCKKPIKSVKRPDGSIISADEFAAQTKAIYDRQLCRDCQKKAQAERAAGAG